MLKKIKPEMEIEKKNKRNQTIVVIVMILLISVSTIGYAFLSREDSSQETENIDYGGLTFIKSSDFWVTEVNNELVYFSNLPNDLSSIEIDSNFSVPEYLGNVLYISNINPSANFILSYLNNKVERTQESCVEGEVCLNSNLPVKDCKTNNIIVYKNPDSINKIYKKDKCVFIEGDFFVGTDALLYKILKII